MRRLRLLGVAASLLLGCSGNPREILNVSYDPTREVFRELNELFLKEHQEQTGEKWSIQMSNGGSSSQARSVIDGIPADVVTLALWQDVDAIRQQRLIGADWEERLPNRAPPWTSTIVFVVRKGNPKSVQDWPDLVKPRRQDHHAQSKNLRQWQTQFPGRLGSVIDRGGSRGGGPRSSSPNCTATPVLDTGARGSTTTFSQKKIGDVQLTWENEAYLEIAESPGELEIVYPQVSIRAEPPVAVVDANVDRKGTRAVAEAYLKFLYTAGAAQPGQASLPAHQRRC